MSRPRRNFIGISLALGLGLHAGCDDASNSPQTTGEFHGKTNVCTDYNTCDECIAGQQERGYRKAEAETMCGAAVVGCFTRWDKPIRCGGKTMEEPSESKE